MKDEHTQINMRAPKSVVDEFDKWSEQLSLTRSQAVLMLMRSLNQAMAANGSVGIPIQLRRQDEFQPNNSININAGDVAIGESRISKGK